MSSHTIVELIESPSESATESVLEILHEGTLNTQSVRPSPNTTRPVTPETDPEVPVNTPPRTPDSRPEGGADLIIDSGRTPDFELTESKPKSESPQVVEVEHEQRVLLAKEDTQAEHGKSEDLDLRPFGAGDNSLPAVLEEIAISDFIPQPSEVPNKSKKSKRKESKKEKKKKKGAEESLEPRPLPQHNEGEHLAEEIQLETVVLLNHDQGEAGVDQEVDFHQSENLSTELNVTPVVLDPEQHNEIVSALGGAGFYKNPDSVFDIPDDRSHDIVLAYEDNAEEDSNLIFGNFEPNRSAVSEVFDLQQHSKTLSDSEKSDRRSGLEYTILHQEVVNPNIYTTSNAESDTLSAGHESCFGPGPASQLRIEQQEPTDHEVYSSESKREVVVGICGTLEPESIAEGFTASSPEPVLERVIAPELDAAEELGVVRPETESVVQIISNIVPQRYLGQDTTVTEPIILPSPGNIGETLYPILTSVVPTIDTLSSSQYSTQSIVAELAGRDHTPEQQPISVYLSTVEDSPEGVESSASAHSDIHTPENTADIACSTSAMALQDRSLIASQLSDALALFNSFDESVKSLVTRLQSNDNNFITKPEHGGSAPIASATFNVPYSRNPSFHGRFSTLSKIFGMWRPHQRCRIGVAGLGGFGKTELVLEFVYRARQVSPSTPVFWFGPDNIRSKDSSSSAPAGLQLEDWLRSYQDPDAMLVVDSGDKFDLYETTSDRGSFVDHLRDFQGTVILISRNSRDGNIIARPHEICKVHELELDACVNLMCDHLEVYAHDASSEREIQEVVKSLNCIPRAIIQATKVINSTQMTVSQFHEMYSTSETFKLRLFSRIDPYSKPDQDTSVIGGGVFNLRSFRKSNTEPSRLLYQIYYMGGKAVPCSLVSTDDPLNKILLMLVVKAHFMIEEDVASQTFSIHPMVYLAMRKALGNERPLSDESEMMEERKWYDEIVLAFSKHYPDANCESRAWWKECFEHLISDYTLHNDKLKIAIATVYQRESSFFKRKGLFAEALKMASLARSVLPDPLPSECLTIVQDQITLLDFLAKYREVHEMLRGLTMEVGHPGNLWKKSMMAKLEVADCANRYDSAIEIFRQVRTAGEAANADKLDLSNATDDLGLALMQKGRYREAAAECRKALAERSSRLGNSHTDTLSSCHNLAEILHKDGKFEESYRYIQEALRGRETVLGVEHPETLHSKVLRARVQISKATTTGEFDEAESVLNYAMEKLSIKLSPSHPIVMTCKSETARIMFARGKYETAEAINQSVLAAREQGPWLEPATHPDTMTSRNQLADVIRLKDGSKAADNLSERCLTERTVVLTNGSLTGEDFHPDQLASLHNRAVILSGLGQYLAALQKIDLSLLGRKAILGEHHPDYFTSMTWKGEIMRAQLHRYQSERTQTLDTIENLHKQAYEGLSWILGSEHQSSLQCATHMALAKPERGSPASSEAEGLFRQIHCAYQHNMGDFHPETLKSKGRLAEAMRAASPRHHLEAKKLWRDSCGGLTRIYGFDAHVTANAYKGYEKFLRTYPDP